MKLERTLRDAPSARFDFVAVGENSLDMIAVGPAARAGGHKGRLASLAELPGGQASTAAVACARLGWRSRYVGAVGDDAAGRTIQTGLTSEGVDVVIVTRAGARTRRAIVIVDEKTGDRLVFEDRDPALDLGPADIPDAVFTDARILLVDASDVQQSIRAARTARSANVRTMVDIDEARAGIADLLTFIDIIVLSGDVVADLAGVEGMGRGLNVIGQASGAAAVVATMGEAGALAWADGQEIGVPVHPTRVLDTTGAGDAFRAGLAAAWLGSAGTVPDLRSLLQDAALVASLNCRAVGAQTALPRRDEVPARLRGGV